MLTAKLAPTCSRFRYRLSFSYILVKKSSDAFINSFNTGRIYLPAYTCAGEQIRL